MAVTYSAAAKTARMNAVVTTLGSGAKIKIGTAGMAQTLAVITLDATAGTVSGDLLTFSGFPKSDTSADASGTAAAAVITTSGDVTVISGLTVGTSAADIILDSVSITAGQTVTLNSATIQHAA